MLRNDTPWLDDAGSPIQAHGGWILPVRDAEGGTTYYWYGEDKSGLTVNRRMDAIGIRCYRSRDLVSWHDCGTVLAVDPASPHVELRPSGVTERPRVLRCPSTGRYVMWFHADDAAYASASCGVAVADSPEGPFELVRVLRPNRHDSRDLTLFAEEDGTAWLAHSSEGNATLHLSRLTSDYLDVDGCWSRAFVDQFREAPCLFAAADQLYLLTSGCTGWRPNPAMFAYSPQVVGSWRLIGEPCRGPREHTTFDGQVTCVFRAGERLLALIDHWHPDDLGSSTYSLLPVDILDERHFPIELRWSDTFDPTHMN